MCRREFRRVCGERPWAESNADSGYLRRYSYATASRISKSMVASCQAPAPPSQASPNAAPSSTTCGPAAIEASSSLSADSHISSSGGRRCGSTAASGYSASSSCAGSGRGLCSPSLFLELPCCCFSPCLLFCCTTLGGLLSISLLLLDGDEVL
jgi:hypothetical protein